MPKHVNSFVVRCWQLDDGEQRIEIEHIQSGERCLMRSMAAAFEWICAERDDPDHGRAVAASCGVMRSEVMS